MTALRICFIGDSITAGTGDDDCLGWPGRLCAAERRRGHDVTLYNLGIRGDTSAMIAPRWRAECAARLPDTHPGALVFAFGINDTAQEADGSLRVPPERSIALAQQILSEAKAWKPTLMIGPTPLLRESVALNFQPTAPREMRDDRIAATSKAYAALGAEIGVPYLDLFAALQHEAHFRKSMAQGDGVHPTAEGYAAMAALIGRWPAWRTWFDR
jgi:lysophospholipase L1-like esterase